jgi:hypothetical protein
MDNEDWVVKVDVAVSEKLLLVTISVMVWVVLAAKVLVVLKEFEKGTLLSSHWYIYPEGPLLVNVITESAQIVAGVLKDATGAVRPPALDVLRIIPEYPVA